MILKDSKALDDIVGASLTYADKLIQDTAGYERYSKRTLDSIAKFVDNSLEANSAQARMRRAIAFLIAGAFVLAILWAAIAYHISAEYGKHMTELARMLRDPAIVVVVFYFGRHIVDTAVRGASARGAYTRGVRDTHARMRWPAPPEPKGKASSELP